MQFFKTVTGDVVVYKELENEGFSAVTNLVEVSLNYAIVKLVNKVDPITDVFYKGYPVEMIEYVAETDSVIIDGIEEKLTEELLKDFDNVKELLWS